MNDMGYEPLYDATVPAVASVYREPGGRGAGSGFLFDDGHLPTDEHVVRDRRTVDVRFDDGSWATGEVVGSDVYTDLAVVALDRRPDGVDPLTVAGDVAPGANGDTDRAETTDDPGSAGPRPGQPVAALGNPLGPEGSITTGVVSGVDRSMPTSGGFAVPDVVQTDAPINPGNSGGPLVAATDGYPVVGVNRARSGDNIGFAVSPRVVSTVVPALLDEGRYRHAYLKVKTVDVTPRIAEANGLDEPHGVFLVDVGPTGGDRLRGSLRARRVDGAAVPVGGDVIVGFGGEPVRSHEELTRLLLTDAAPGEPVALDVVRDGRERTLETVPAERPASPGGDEGRATAAPVR